MIAIPPLRERGFRDIQALADYFVQKYNPRCSLTADAVEALSSYHWPGNVRELENTIERALHICDGKGLTPEHLSLPLESEPSEVRKTGTLREMEQHLISATLERTGFNMAETAKQLGISRATLYRKAQSYKIKRAGD
jgi:DNA-binding NtrC family response regulator